jgi:hypothetical protein
MPVISFSETEYLLNEAQEIASLVGVDLETIKVSSMRLEIAIHKMVIAEVVFWYALLDEILGELIVRYFFKVEPETLHFEDQWKTPEFKIFVHHILDEMFLLKKASVVHAIEELPSDVNKVLPKVNAVKNALAHSFFPENRKEFKSTGKVLYNDVDIRTAPGLRLFFEEPGLYDFNASRGTYHPRRGPRLAPPAPAFPRSEGASACLTFGRGGCALSD